MHKRILLGAAVLLLAGMACDFSVGGGGGGTGGTGGTGSGDVLYQDDFSSTGSGWDRSSSDIGDTDYQDGAYHIFVGPEFSSRWANPSKNFTDVRVEVDAHKISGVDDNEYGVICRYQDVDDFAGTSISSDGYYGFFQISGGEFGYIGMDAMQPSDAINLGSETNHIRLDCVGPTLTLYVNGTLVGSATHSTFSDGDVGLYAGTFSTPDIDILFDNFVVYQP